METQWTTLLYICIVGFALTLGVLIVVTRLGIRWHQELPKLPIVDTIEALKLQREEREAELEEIREKLYEARQVIEESERKQEALIDLRNELEETEKAIEAIGDKKAELDRVTAELEAATERVAEGAAASKEREDYLAELDLRKQNLQQEVNELEEKRAEADRITEQIATLTSDEAELKEEVQKHLKALADSEKELEALSDKIKTFEEKEAEMARKEADLAKSQAKIEGDLKSKLEEIDRLDEQLNSTRDILTEVSTAVTTAAGAVPEGHDPCEDLWKPYFPNALEPRTDSNESRELDRIAQEFRDAEIKFDQRTLWAFHTCLKSQDISPLTVLAGISGTGKSLLPRVYARCMGINFLNLPVQPGWNSPQDLFGFYNYIEHKYKATPLARVMVQFEQYNRESWPMGDAPDLTDQVLLVLLDEMNLARVEYYFSEHLSRLEIRRGIDSEDEEARRPVEIPLDIGHGAEKYSSINLFPGSNILFTGTMNEDESTQALSDKVLDRSCVLRFGKPEQYDLKQPDEDDLPKADPLALTTWKDWCEEGNPPAGTDEFIKKLGEVMELARKPFGRRTGHAIARYIEMYPDQTPAGVRNAMSDQVEQRICPKLRGLDLEVIQMAASALENIVREDLDDDLLAGAINKGAAAEGGMFEWDGIDRADD